MSKNCLITRLKAVVNDDSLPILETMQQFTLDAIAASGNQNMSDAQKWALNKFFTSIGAPNNSGVFSKMDYIFLPAICNHNLAKAMVNYKDNNVVSQSDTAYKFDGNGVVKGDSVTGNYGVLALGLYSTFTQDDFSLILGVKPPTISFTRNPTIYKIANSNDASVEDRPTVSVTTNTKDYHNITLLSYRFTVPAVKWSSACICSYDGNKRGTFVYNSSNVVHINGNLIGEEPELGESVNLIQFYAELPLHVIMYGKGLTDTERDNVAKAVNDLVVAFS